jgi:hypothetical protein
MALTSLILFIRVFQKVKMLEKFKYIKRIVLMMILSSACGVIQHIMDYGLEKGKNNSTRVSSFRK